MSEKSNFKCNECIEFVDLDCGDPMRNFDGQLFCARCVKKLGLNECEEFKDKKKGVKVIDEITKVSLKNEIAYCTQHPNLQAYYFCNSSLRLFCKQCNPNNQYSKLAFGKDSAKTKLKTILESKLNSDYYENYIKKAWRNRLNGTGQEIYKCLLEAHFFENSQPICLEHLQVSQFYDYQEFKFKCQLCVLTQATTDYAQYKDSLAQYCLEIIKTVNTSSLNSHISKALRSKIYEKDFFYAMNSLNSDKSTQITIGICCFVCGMEFGLGKTLPVKLHDNPIHEICYTCYIYYKPTQCYLDSKNISESQGFDKCTALYKLKSRACIIHEINDGTEKFSYYLHRYPYFFCCNDYICEHCKSKGGSTGGSAMCNNCGTPINTYILREDQTLINQLKFLETFCDTHQDQISKYFDSTNIKTYCALCKQVPPRIRNEISAEKIDEAVNKLLKEKYIKHSYLYTEFIAAYQIYPLIVKLRAYRFYESSVKLSQESKGQIVYNTEETSLRFKKIQPTLMNAFMRWYLRSPKKYEIFISCRGSLEMLGLIVGKSFTENSTVTITYSGIIIANSKISRVYNEEYHDKINFNCIVPLNSTGVVLQVEFSAGGYIHGGFRSLDPDFNFKGIPITVRSNNNCKDLERGGPLLGFSFSKFYIADNERP